MNRGFLYISIVCSAFLITMGSNSRAEMSAFESQGRTWRSGCDSNSCYITLPIEITAKPGNIFDAIHACTDNKACVAAVAALVQAAGGDGATVVQYAGYYNTAYPMIAGTRNGNENWIYLNSPQGYVPCGIKWSIWSVASSVISATFKHDGGGVIFYANVPHKKFLEGSSWIKVLYEIRFDRACKMQDGLEINQFGVVYQNSNDPNRSGVNGMQGER